MNYLEDLYLLIMKGDKEGIVKFLLKNRHTDTSFEQFVQFTNLFAPDLKAVLKNSFNNSGSGGSRIYKPNISSIACIYTAAVLKEPVAKVGSAAITSVSGSTDFFRSLGLVGIANKEYVLKKFNFVYCDVLEIAPWKPYADILRCNPDLKKILDSTIYHYYSSKVEMYGVLGENSHLNYASCKHINAPGEYHTYYSVIDQKLIDEIVGIEIYVDNQKVEQLAEGVFPASRLHREDINKLNTLLLVGECADLYWVDSLIKTVALCLFFFGYSHNLQECVLNAQKAYKDKAGIKLIEAILESTK